MVCQQSNIVLIEYREEEKRMEKKAMGKWEAGWKASHELRH